MISWRPILQGVNPSKGEHRALTTALDEIRKALKAIDLMKMLDGQVAVGNKSNAKVIGEHKVSSRLR